MFGTQTCDSTRRVTYLVVPLFEGLLGQTVPAFSTVDRFGSLKRDIKISTLDG